MEAEELRRKGASEQNAGDKGAGEQGCRECREAEVQGCKGAETHR